MLKLSFNTAILRNLSVFEALKQIKDHGYDVLNKDDVVDMHKLDPVIYEDVLHDYFRIGEKCGDAFSVGVKYRRASEIKKDEGELWKR